MRGKYIFSLLFKYPMLLSFNNKIFITVYRLPIVDVKLCDRGLFSCHSTAHADKPLCYNICNCLLTTNEKTISVKWYLAISYLFPTYGSVLFVKYTEFDLLVLWAHWGDGMGNRGIIENRNGGSSVYVYWTGGRLARSVYRRVCYPDGQSWYVFCI